MTAAPARFALISEGVATTWPVYVALGLGLFRREDIAVEVTVQKEVKAALAAGMSKEEMVAKLRFPQYSHLRNYDRINVFEALHHLYTTGKPPFSCP